MTTDAFAAHMKSSGIGVQIAALRASIDVDDVVGQEAKSAQIRALIVAADMPGEVEASIRSAYGRLGTGADQPVAVRSSATAGDMPNESFAGQQDTYLWVVGADDVVIKVKACWASLFNARAITSAPEIRSRRSASKWRSACRRWSTRRWPRASHDAQPDQRR